MLSLLSSCGTSLIKKTPIIEPHRIPNEEVHFQECKDNSPLVCITEDDFKKLLKNRINTEAYIRQLQNLLNILAEPVKP